LVKNQNLNFLAEEIRSSDKAIEVDVFQLPDGEYQISQSQTCNAVNKPPKRMVELAASEKGQILVQSGFKKGLKVSVEGSKPVSLVPLEVAFQFWVLELSIGNQQALALVVACGIEALERRADNAFGILSKPWYSEGQARKN
jgi:hypothetical protein